MQNPHKTTSVQGQSSLVGRQGAVLTLRMGNRRRAGGGNRVIYTPVYEVWQTQSPRVPLNLRICNKQGLQNDTSACREVAESLLGGVDGAQPW